MKHDYFSNLTIEECKKKLLDLNNKQALLHKNYKYKVVEVKNSDKIIIYRKYNIFIPSSMTTNTFQKLICTLSNFEDKTKIKLRFRLRKRDIILCLLALYSIFSWEISRENFISYSYMFSGLFLFGGFVLTIYFFKLLFHLDGDRALRNLVIDLLECSS